MNVPNSIWLSPPGMMPGTTNVPIGAVVGNGGPQPWQPVLSPAEASKARQDDEILLVLLEVD